MGTVIAYRGDGDRPRAELALDSGERVRLTLDSGGFFITQRDGSAVFHGDVAMVARLCASLVEAGSAATPLQILLGVVTQLPSVQAVKAAFETAAARAGS